MPDATAPSEDARPPSVFDRAFLTGAEHVTEVLLIRHARQEIDPEAAVGDLIDPPLSEHGLQQARLVGAALSTTKLDAIYCSPLARASQTAEAICAHHRLEREIIADLREVEIFRDLPPEKTVLEFLGRDVLKAVRQRMLAERRWDVYPHSESSAEFRKRTVNAIEALIARHASGRIAVVCHGGVINAYAAHIIGTPYDMFFRPAHASISIVAAGDGVRALRLLNDVHHLQTGEGDAVTF